MRVATVSVFLTVGFSRLPARIKRRAHGQNCTDRGYSLILNPLTEVSASTLSVQTTRLDSNARQVNWDSVAAKPHAAV